MTQHKEDLQSVERMLNGHEGEFDTFYDVYYDRVYRFCLRRVGDKDLADDLVQLTLERVVKYMYSYQGEASLYTWVCQICRNVISTWYKRAGNNPNLHVTLDENPGVVAMIESENSDGGSEMAGLELAQIVHLALDALPPKYSAVLQMKYFDGMSTREISLDLETTLVAAESLLARARTSFKNLVNDMNAEQHDASLEIG